MNSKALKEIENNICENPTEYDNVKPIDKSLLISSIIHLSITTILVFISLFLVKAVNLLSIIPPGVFYTIVILYIIYMVSSILLSTVLKRKIMPLKKLLYFKIFDTVSFVTMLVIAFSFIIMFLITPTTVLGQSMNHTLDSGDKVLVWHMGYEPKREDIVVVEVSEKYGLDHQLYIKRVVAVEGDTISFADGAAYVNGNKLEDMALYTFQQMAKKYADESDTELSYIIPNGYSIVMGDHRSSSEDSRRFGLVDNDDIIGKAVFSLVPFRKISNKKLSYQ